MFIIDINGERFTINAETAEAAAFIAAVRSGNRGTMDVIVQDAALDPCVFRPELSGTITL